MISSYILLIELPEQRRIPVGQLGVIDFPSGFYVYLGSAMNGLESRVKRHLRRDKKLRWHIDYLLSQAHIVEVILLPGEQRVECALAQALARTLSPIPHFGSSGCRCKSHLFFHRDRDRIKAELAEAVSRNA
jgi:sugar fermentation stimulation protein A